MCKLLKNTKGAVTIFVTLLLIPAILVSGSAVDLARIYTARSIVQDANQLASNSLLTQYDALLQDIYGLYGIMQSDPELGDMLNEYIEVAVFGEGVQKNELGTFQLFYGSELQPVDIEYIHGKNLSDPEVLRRQIEEYAKYRVPVIIMKEIWDRIEKFKKLKADAEVIEKKMAIDEKIDEINDIYEDIYDLINDINTYPWEEQNAFNNVNEYLVEINKQLKSLVETRKEYTNAFDENNEEKYEDMELKYKGIKQNIKSLIEGGSVVSGWVSGDYNEDGIWVDGEWDRSVHYKGLKKSINDCTEDLEGIKDKMGKLIEKCENADKKKAELLRMVDDLEARLNKGDCSEELKKGMSEPQQIKREDGSVETQDSIIKQYKDLLSYELKPMAQVFRGYNVPYIDKVIETLENLSYGNIDEYNVVSVPRISLEKLSDVPDDIFWIGNTIEKRTVVNTDTETLEDLAGLTRYKYTALNKYKPFQDEKFNEAKNKEFYDKLTEMFNNKSDGAKKVKDDSKDKIGDLLGKVQGLYQKITLSPEGALYFKNEGSDDSTGFGNEGEWSKTDGNNSAKSLTKKALKGNIVDQIGDLMDGASNKILLLTYDTEMFSNFTTVPDTLTMSGIPMNTRVNYFFQSELEYLYHGDETSAKSNIWSVCGLIFLTRFVFNYISTFIIDDVRYELTLISAPAGPYATLVRELARIGYALAESALDMKELMAGRGIPLLKTDSKTWAFSLHSLASIPETLAGMVAEEKGDKDDGMFYIDYLRIFLLFRDGDILAERTSDLIGWNMTNYKNGIEADEEKMTSAELYNMARVHTDFKITTTVDMRMLFLSMAFAQKGIDGVVPPKTMPITVTDYRGY